jgi:hypothetical protein
MSKKPRLSVVPPAISSNDPPRKLDAPGRSLWDRVMAEYDIADSGGMEMLCQACQALDRAEALRAEIDRDGEVLRVRGSVREHPALKHELASRSFVVRALARLNLNVEPLRPSAGRPPGAMGGW